ncbi:hypothetical protein ACTXG5_17500 [Mycobacterium sp. Dal123C01]|uniref:hypothetical protein n=1 Tax=Mycobacterium sp. Dal123C01 TaxID=3457577 RepID=UPI00403E5D1B
MPAVGVVGACGSGGGICGGGTAPAVALPACMPLSKLCTKSAGVTGWTGPEGALGAPAKDVAPAVGRPELGAPTIGVPGAEEPP